MDSKKGVQEKKPALVLKEFLAQKDKGTNDPAAMLRSERYAHATSDDKEARLKSGTIGLVQHDDFKRLKAEIEQNRPREIIPTISPEEEEARKKKYAKMEKKRKSKLSFAFNEEETDDTSEAATPSGYDSSTKPSRSASVLDDNDEASTKRKRLKLGKDPTVNTSFLPDRDREEQEQIQKEKEREEWLKKQEEIKAETVDIQFAYFDGLSHLGTVTVKKDEPVFNFIDRAKQQFSAIRDIATERLMFAKDDLIIPHELSFYYFAAHEVKSKYGPLFEFYDPDVPARPRNKNDPRLGKIVSRKYADTNKHIYPCSKWELYDPEKDVTPVPMKR